MNLLFRLFIFFIFLVQFLYSKEELILNKIEKEYLQENKILNIYIEPNIYFYTYTYGNYTNGYTIEYLKVLADRLDITFNFITNITREEAKDKLEEGLIDIALFPSFGLSKNKPFQFSTLPIGILRPALLIPKIYQIPPNLGSAENLRVATLKGSELIQILNLYYPEIEIEAVDDITTAITKIERQEVDLAIGLDEIFSSYIDYQILPKLKSVPIVNNGNFPIVKLFLATSNKNRTLIDIINKAMLKLDFNDLFYLRNQFFHADVLRQTNITIPLSQSEQFYLMGKQVLNVCTIPKDMPYGNISQNRYQGIGADLVNIVEKRLDTPIQLVPTQSKEESVQMLLSKQCDFLSLDTQTLNENIDLKYTLKIFEVPLVLITSNNVLYISDFNKIIDKTFVIRKQHPMISHIKQKYPSLKLIEVNTEIEGLKQIETNKQYGLITSLYSVSSLFRNHNADNLKISAQIPINMPFNFVVLKSEDIMLSILNKTIEHSLKNEIENILEKRISKRYPQGFDHTIILLLVLVFVIFFIIMFRQHYIVSLQKESLFKLNENLETRISKAVEVNREKDMLMYRQNRFASMGEMIGNIAHQWRQPLTELSALLMELQASIHFKNKIKNEEVLDVVNSSNKVIKFMSQTIDDFRNFFSENKELNYFSINEVIEDSIHIMNLALQHQHISLEVIAHSKEIQAYGLKNEYSQVVINIISNAKDMLNLRKVNNGKITITIEEEGEFSKVSIADNAGGIEEEDLSKIFEPFFTKKKTNGTGIGLFMSKMIIENNMKGILHAHNSHNGAIFTIYLAKIMKKNG